MKCNKLVIYFLIFSVFSCSKFKTKIKIDEEVEASTLTVHKDYLDLVLTVERGAFHYDKFILKDTVLTFYPSQDNLSFENKSYNQFSEQKISKIARDKFIKKIIEQGFFKMKNSYSSESSCNSSLTVTLKFNDKSKKIISEDFKTECPELLKFIEKEIIRLHKKNLKRISLPG